MFIAFEGIEGCGKSFQSRVLFRKLQSENIPAILTYEPGGTVVGNKIRSLIKDKNHYHISPEVELFLIMASRSQLVSEVIKPALKEHKLIVCDRFSASTVAYQGYGRGIELKLIDIINKLASQSLEPDLNILLDLPVEAGLQRKRFSKSDRFENEDITFHQRVRDGYLKLARENKERWLVIDAKLSRKHISSIIWDKVSYLLGKFC